MLTVFTNIRSTKVEDDLRWKTTFGGRWSSVEYDLQWILACCLVRFASFFLKMGVNHCETTDIHLPSPLPQDFPFIIAST